MLYSNTSLKAEARQFDFGTIYQVGLGELGRGRKLMALTCKEDTKIQMGMNATLTIGTTRSGKYRINEGSDDTLYMLLSSKGGYTRRGCGTIQVLEKEKEGVTVLAKGWGADGAAGRIGTWDAVLLKVSSCSIVKVRTSGAGYGTPTDYYVIHNGIVYHCHADTIAECCDTLGIDFIDVANEEWEVL